MITKIIISNHFYLINSDIRLVEGDYYYLKPEFNDGKNGLIIEHQGKAFTNPRANPENKKLIAVKIINRDQRHVSIPTFFNIDPMELDGKVIGTNNPLIKIKK